MFFSEHSLVGECERWCGCLWLIRVCWCDSEDKCDAMEEIQEELDAVKQSEQRLRSEVSCCYYGRPME